MAVGKRLFGFGGQAQRTAGSGHRLIDAADHSGRGVCAGGLRPEHPPALEILCAAVGHRILRGDAVAEPGVDLLRGGDRAAGLQAGLSASTPRAVAACGQDWRISNSQYGHE